MMQVQNTISVIICCYTEQRWEDLLAAVASVRKQTLRASEIIVVVDHNPLLLQRVQEYLPDVIAMENKGPRGLSGARNSGIARARGSLVAFLDDDAIAMPDWLKLLQEDLRNPQVLGTGGAVLPLWSQQRAAWFPEEFLWVVGCTYRGMPQTSSSIRNPIGANMAFRREVFDGVGGFLSEIGRVGTRPVGCEETELCIRARQHWPQRRFQYKPEASVSHRVPANRMTWRYFSARCYAEGLSKAFVTKNVGSDDGLASERTYTLKILPEAIRQGFVDAFVSHDWSGIARSVAILLGLLITILGYVVAVFYLTCTRSKKARPSHALTQYDSLTPQTDPVQAVPANSKALVSPGKGKPHA